MTRISLFTYRLVPIALCASLVCACGIGDSEEGSELVRFVDLPRLEARPGPLFHLVDPEVSGLDFVNRLENHHQFPYLTNGAGVTVGDYDNDGLPDVYLVSQDGPNRLFRQVAPFRFEDTTEEAGVDGGDAWGTGASFVDIDDDGDLDLFVCNTAAPNLVYVNQGDGTFREDARSFGLEHGGAATMAAFADYDRDGDLDLYLLNNRELALGARDLYSDLVVPGDTVKTLEEMLPPDLPRLEQGEIPEAYRPWWAIVKAKGAWVHFAGQRDVLYRNDGGHFTDVTDQAGIAGFDMGLSATWWDYDADGWPDLYVANDLETPDHLYHNNGDGTFSEVTEASVPHTPWFAMGADFADINNDGRMDLLVADMSSTTHYKQKLIMGSMSSRRWFLENATPQQYMRNALYLNTGTDRFMEVAYLSNLASSDWTWAVKFGDLDNDGWIDVFFANGVGRFDLDPDFIDRMKTATVEDWLEGVKKLPPLPEKNLAFRNTGDLHFDDVSAEWGIDFEGVSQGAAYADFDHDGDLDLVVSNLNQPALLYRNESADGHRILIRLIGTESNRYGIGARVTLENGAGVQVRELTLARGYMSSDEPLIHFGLGKRSAAFRLTIDWPSGLRQTLEDLEVDRFYTITEPAPTDSADGAASREPETRSAGWFTPAPGARAPVHREIAFDDYEAQPLLPYRLSQLGPGLASADVDGDGREDLYLSGAAGQPGRLLRQGRPRYRPKSFLADSASEDMAPLFFDADGDGDLDLYVVSGGVEAGENGALLRDRLYLNDGHGRFARAPLDALPDIRDSGSVVAAADFDRDGDLDLFVGGRVVPGRYPETPNSRLLANNGGKFEDVTDAVAPGLRTTGLVTSAVWSDADADGWIDLLITHEWGPIKLYSNREGRFEDRSEEAGLSSKSGWWNGIAARDIDGDGDIDYVVTNFGLNTKYSASSEQPTRLFYGDFVETGSRRLVEATYEEDILYPVRGKSCSTAAMPGLEESFDTYRSFAAASLEDLYTTEGLSASKSFDANTLESSVLINDGQGRFSFRPLPRLAQASPAFGVVLTELDGDGRPDLVIAQNFFGLQPETGHMDGGLSLLLRGNGDGSFAPVWPHEGGLIVPGDATAVSVTDINGDGRPDLRVAVNNGELLTFLNTTPVANRMVTVKLRGSRGNPTAVGSRVTLELDDATQQTAEVHAGGGYLSQSSSALAFGLGPTAQISRIVVRWPDGSTSVSAGSDDSEILLVQPPGASIARRQDGPK